MTSLLRLLRSSVQCPSCRHAVEATAGSVRWNSNKAGICKMQRSAYARTYPTVLVFPDGSSINIRYKEPRRIITLPINLETLSENDKRLRLLRRKPREKQIEEEIFDDSFSVNEYSKFWKKK